MRCYGQIINVPSSKKDGNGIAKEQFVDWFASYLVSGFQNRLNYAKKSILI